MCSNEMFNKLYVTWVTKIHPVRTQKLCSSHSLHLSFLTSPLIYGVFTKAYKNKSAICFRRSDAVCKKVFKGEGFCVYNLLL